MRTRLSLLTLIGIGLALALWGCGGGGTDQAADDMPPVEVNQAHLAMFKPLPLIFKSPSNPITRPRSTWAACSTTIPACPRTTTFPVTPVTT